VPRCGALGLIQKPLHYRGAHQNSCPRPNGKFAFLPACLRRVPSQVSRFVVNRNSKSGSISQKCDGWPVRRRGGPRRGDARYRLKHAASRLPLAGPPCHRRSTPSLCAADAGGVTTVQTCISVAPRREAKANDSDSSKASRRECYLATAQIKPIIFTSFRCTPAGCSPPAATASRRRGQRLGHHNEVPATNNKRRRV
jgi:hypothetical protein